MALTTFQPKGHHKQSMLQKGIMKMFRYEPDAGKFVHKKTNTEKGTIVKKGLSRHQAGTRVSKQETEDSWFIESRYREKFMV